MATSQLVTQELVAAKRRYDACRAVREAAAAARSRAVIAEYVAVDRLTAARTDVRRLERAAGTQEASS